jgi:NADPH:quinone reductase-like Zn-dependent oxidoreductase
MRVVAITKRGGPEVLQVQERPDPILEPGKVLVDVRAAGVNFADTMARVGMYPDAPKLPAVVGYEVAGTVAELGDGVEGLAVGDRVMAGTRFGGYAERVVVRRATSCRFRTGSPSSRAPPSRSTTRLPGRG